MTFCYVLMAHTAPAQVEHTVRRIRLLSPSADVIVRHATTGVFDRERLAAAGARELRSTTQMRWGDWSMVLAVLEALRVARQTTNATHVVLLSGQDYPVRDLADWEREVRASGADALIDVFPPLPEDWSYAWRRILPSRSVPAPARRIAGGIWRRTWRPLRKAVLWYDYNGDPRWYLGVRRLRPGPMPVVKGSLWMTLSAPAIDAVLERHDHDVTTRRWFERVRIPDESYLQSLLADDPSVSVLCCPTTHARFAFGNPNALPLTVEELALAAAGPAAFARKLSSLDPQLVAIADQLARRTSGECIAVHDVSDDAVRLTGPEAVPGRHDRAIASCSGLQTPA